MRPHRSLLLAILLIWPTLALSHGGGLNSYGCHNQTSDGIYHCHQGEYEGQSFESEQDFLDFVESGGQTSDPDTPSGSIPVYNRDDYLPDWADTDSDCISTRHEVLIIESLIPVTMSSNGCFVSSGQWYDPAIDQFFTNPSDVDIDHHVPLYEAHLSGGHAWTTSQKQLFANDMLLASTLVPMDDGTNQSKSAGDPGMWLPPNSTYHCEYVRNWVEVKEAYGLTYDAEERQAIETILGSELELGARERVTGERLDGLPTEASFGIGLRKGSQCGYVHAVLTSEAIELTLDIRPDSSDLGQPVNLYLLAAVGSDTFMVTGSGLAAWAGTIESLVPLVSNIDFSQSITYTLFSGELDGPATVILYVAYGHPDSLVYTPVPFTIEIADL